MKISPLAIVAIVAAGPTLVVKAIKEEMPEFEDLPWCEHAEEELIRLTGDERTRFDEDGQSIMMDLPNCRKVSTAISTGYSPPSQHFLSNLVWCWGQLIDHDMDLSSEMSDESIEVEGFNDIPDDDREWSELKASGQCLFFPFHRSEGTLGTPRQNFNDITALHDSSMVYGHGCDDRHNALRDQVNGLGLMDMREHRTRGFLPFNTQGFANAGGDNDQTLHFAGDVRANEQAGLDVMHTVLVRNHNRIAEKIRAHYFDETDPCGPGTQCDEKIYQMARKMNAAMVQHITYNEFLPALLGKEAPDMWNENEIDESLPAQISQEFSTVCYRIGHTMISGEDLVKGRRLRQFFFNPAMVEEFPVDHPENFVDLFLHTMAVTEAREIDVEVTNEVQSNLFGGFEETGMCVDLLAANICRARDHGIPTQHKLREGLGLEPYTEWSQITDDEELIERLKECYGEENIADVDAFVIAMAEKKHRTSQIGETCTHVLQNQFMSMMKRDHHFMARDKMMLQAMKGDMDYIVGKDEWTMAAMINLNTGPAFRMDHRRNAFFTHGNSGVWGDPHFKDWSGENFDFHGECDLVLGHVPSFGNGLGLSVHVRTRHIHSYSYVEAAAIQIGDDQFELGSYGEYFFNGVEDAEFDANTTANLSGYPLFFDWERSNKKKAVFHVQLSDDSRIILTSYKELVRVDWDISGADEDQFKDIRGLMGSWHNGIHFARDGATILEDVNEFGHEWQVRLGDDPKLFQEDRWPQYPTQCFMPSDASKVNRRLGQSVISDQLASKACAHIKDRATHVACVDDILATQDLSVGEGVY